MKQKKFMFLCGIMILSICLLTSIFSYFCINEIVGKEKVLASAPEIAIKNQKTKITKKETKDYYYYSIEDYERDLSYSWQFEKEKDENISVEDSLYISEDLRLSIDANTKGAEEISNRVDQKKLIISFDYHGALPLKTTVKINVSKKFQNGEHLYLYYYNPESDEIEYIMHDVEVKNGYVEFQIDHCSDYFLTAAVVNDAINNPQSVNIIIIGLIVVVFILIAITLIQSKNK